jgi:hypothetical protein
MWQVGVVKLWVNKGRYEDESQIIVMCVQLQAVRNDILGQQDFVGGKYDTPFNLTVYPSMELAS